MGRPILYPEMQRPPRRRSLFVSLPAALSILFASAAGASPDVEDPALRTQTTVLENGLTVLTLEDHATPVVSIQMWVKVGSRDEARFTGLAHLFEHMMFKGSKHIAPEEHAQLIQARGGQLNAFTSRDYTVYFADVTTEALPLVIDLEAERVAHLDISEKTLESEREVVIEERRMRTEDQPMGRATEALFALHWQALPYRWPVIGWKSDLEAMTVDVCRDFFDTYYAPNNIVLAIVGDFEAEDALARVRRAFGKLERETIPRNPTKEPEQKGERRQTVYYEVRSPILAAAWHAPPTGHPDAEALDVASFILSSGRSSRLYRKLVYDAQAALSAEGSYWELIEAGVFYAFASVRPDSNIDRVEKLFFDEIARLHTEPVSEEELSQAKRQLEVGLVNGLASNHALASRIGRETATFGRVRPLEERLAAIQAVTAEDVQRVAKTYLVDEKRSVVHVVSPPRSQR